METGVIALLPRGCGEPRAPKNHDDVTLSIIVFATMQVTDCTGNLCLATPGGLCLQQATRYAHSESECQPFSQCWLTCRAVQERPRRPNHSGWPQDTPLWVRIVSLGARKCQEARGRGPIVCAPDRGLGVKVEKGPTGGSNVWLLMRDRGSVDIGLFSRSERHVYITLALCERWVYACGLAANSQGAEFGTSSSSGSAERRERPTFLFTLSDAPANLGEPNHLYKVYHPGFWSSKAFCLIGRSV